MADHVMVCLLSTGDFIFLSCVFSIRSMTAEGLRSQLRLAGCEPAPYSYTSVPLLCLNMWILSFTEQSGLLTWLLVKWSIILKRN